MNELNLTGPHSSGGKHSPAWLCAALIGVLLLGSSLHGQFVYQESFTGATAAGWEFSQGSTSPGPRLTAAAVPVSSDPEFGASAIDNVGNGWLRLATNTGNQSNAVAFDTSFAAQNAEITIGFDFAFWKPGTSPADGVTAFLWDAAQPFSPGAFGGSLGYANRTGVDGLGGGYVGAGLDVFGNFSNPTEGRNGGTGSRPGQVAVRGAGSGQTGYDFLAGTDSNGLDSLEDIFGTGFRMDFPSSPTRPDQDAADFRRFEMHLDASNNLTVRMQSGFSGVMTDLFTVALTGSRPDQLRFGFAGSTGGLVEVYEIRNLEIRVDGGSNAYYWDNEGIGDLWNTGLNWDQDSVPTDHSYVYFTDQFPDTLTPQTVDLNVSPILNSLTFNGATPYTLQGTGVITFDTDGSGVSYLNNLNSPNGNADQSIANDIVLANGLDVQNLTGQMLTLSGDINTTATGFDLSMVTAATGTIESSGTISGAGEVSVDGFGTTIFTTANTYSGATEVAGGTLRIEDADALGTTGSGTTVAEGATLALAGGQTFAAEPLTLSGTGSTSGGALLNQVGANTWTGAVTLADDATIGASAGTELTLEGALNGAGNELTFQPGAGGTINIDTTISGTGTDVVYADAGTTNLGYFADHTYTGSTTVRSGTLISSSSVGFFSENAFGNSSTAIQLGDSGTAATDDITLLFNTLSPTSVPNWTQVIANREIDVNDFGNEVTLGVTGGDTLQIRQNINLARELTLFADTDSELQIRSVGTGFDGELTGTGDLKKTGEGELTLIGNNTYTGDFLIEEGTVTVSNATDALDSGGRVTLANTTGALLNLLSNETIGSLSGGGATGGNVNIGSGVTLTSGADNTDSTFAGALTGAGDFSKTGTGIMTFTGSSTMTGTTTVSDGILGIGADNVFDDAMGLTLSGGTLQTDGFADALGLFTLTANSTLDFLGKAGGFLTFDDMTRTGGTLTIDNWAGSFSGNGDTRLQVLDNSLGSFGTGPGNLSNITFTGWGDAELIDLGGGLYEIVPQLTGQEWDGSNASNNWNAGTVGVNTNWRTAGNATDNNTAAPNSNGATAIFRDLDPGLDGKTIDLNGDRRLGTIIFDNQGGQSYTIANDRFRMNSGSTAPVFITAAGNGSPTISSRIDMENNPLIITNNTSGTLTLTGSELRMGNNGANSNITVGGAGLTVIEKQLRRNNATNLSNGAVIKNGTGTLRLTNNNNRYSGGTTLNAGTLQIGADGALGTGTFNINGGTIQAFGADRTITNNLALDGDFTVSGSNNLNFGGTQNVSWTGGRTITVEDVTLGINSGKNLQGSGALTLDGDGRMEIRGGNQTFSGGLTVDGGTMAVGSSSSRINNTLRFGGGNAGQSYLGEGDITVNAGGTLEVWKSGNGNLDFRNGVTLQNNGGNILFDSIGTGADLVLGDPSSNSPGNLVQTAGTSTFNIGDDAILGRNASVTVTGGDMTFNLADDFLTQGTSGNGASLEASGTGTIAINLDNGGGSLFSLGEHDSLSVSGPNAGIAVTTTTVAAGGADLDGTVTLSDGGVLSFVNTDVSLNAAATLDGGTVGDNGTLLIEDGNLTVNTAASIVNAPNITFDIAPAGSQVIEGAAPDSNLENLGVLEVRGGGEVLIDDSINNIQAEKVLLTAGTLILGDNDQIANNTGMELAGGTWDTDGFSEVLGTLTLSAESNIDLGNGASIIQFANSNSQTWDPGATIYIDNWSGDFENGGGTDQLIVAGQGLTDAQRAQVVFRNPAGLAPGEYAAVWIGDELVPVPEPATIIGGALLLAFVAWRERRRLFDRFLNRD